MNRRTLGQTGYEVSEIGLGCWQLGGDFGPLGEPTQPIPEDRLRRGFGDGLIWVAVDGMEELVGFALCSDRVEDLYLDQL